jgi:hypothetical protein
VPPCLARALLIEVKLLREQKRKVPPEKWYTVTNVHLNSVLKIFFQVGKWEEICEVSRH